MRGALHSKWPLSLLFFSLTAVAQLKEAKLSPVPTTLSGTLRPLVLAVDGQTRVEEKGDALELTVNGQKIDADESEHSRFFVRTDTDELKVTASMKEGGIREILNLRLPRAEVVGIEGPAVRLAVSGEVREVRIDDTAIELRNGQFVYADPGAPTGEKSLHSLEVSPGPKAAGRLYNLALVTEKPESSVEETTRALLGMSMSRSMQYFQLGLGFGLPSDWELMLCGEFGFGWHRQYRSDGSLVDSRTSINRLAVSFVANKEVFGHWLAVGGIGRWAFRHTYGWMGTTNPSEPFAMNANYSGVQLGVDVRVEPIRWGGFGLSARIDGIVISTIPDSRIYFTLEFNWHW